MSVVAGAQPAAVVAINGIPFFLAKDERQRVAVKLRQVPTQEGDPTIPQRRRWNDWSRGLGDSRGVFRGAVEYAEYAYLPTGRILPGPAVTQIETNLDGDVMDIVEVTAPANRVIAIGGTKAAEINPATHAVATTATLTGTLLSAQLWDDQLAVAAGDSVDYYVRDNAGTYAQNSISKKSRAFGLDGTGQLFRGYGDAVSKCSAANITSVNNWSADYAIGDPSGLVHQVFGHNRWDYVLKSEGLYSFDEDTSKEANVLTDLADFQNVENRQIGRWHDLIFVCSFAGLYRYMQQGAARTVGIEEVDLNESELSAVYPTAFAAFGHWAYVAYYKASTNVTYIVMMRRTLADGDTGAGSPFTICSVVDRFTGLCRAMRISDLPTDTELFYGAGGDVRYFALTRDGRPASYQTGNTVTVRFAPTDFGSPMTLKCFRGLEVIARNPGSIQMKAALDGGSDNNVGTAITSVSGGYAEKFWTRGTNDSGRVLQVVAAVTNASATAPTEIRDVVVNYEERPEMVQGWILGLRFRDFDTEGGIVSEKTGRELRELLEGHLDGAMVEFTDPYGEVYAARFSTFEGDLGDWFPGHEAQVDAAIAVRRLDYS